MADQLENAFNVNGLKEECQDGALTDDKIHISETSIVIDNAGLQDHLIRDEMKQCDISTTLGNIKTELSSSEVQSNIVHGSLKMEKWLGAAEIKTEFNTGLLYCEYCHKYCEYYCIECGMLVHILNKNVSINADNRLIEELSPDNILEINEYFGEYHVSALKVIPVGVRFGPFSGLNKTENLWKIKGGKFVVDKDKTKYLSWMQYINPARNISERNLLIFQYEGNLYFESTTQIQVGDELLVHFGEEYEDRLNINVEMDFIPTAKHIFKDAFACTFCCLGFSSKSYLAKHKTICPRNSASGFSDEELMQCPSCKSYMYQKEYLMHHMVCCCDTKYNQTTVANGITTRSRLFYKCAHCKYSTKFKGDLKNHTNQHYEVKMYKCEFCCRRFKTKEILRQHLENTHIYAGEKKDLEYSTGGYTKAHLKAEYLHLQDEMKQFKCSLCAFRTKYKLNLKSHVKTKHLREFIYKCDRCDYKTNYKCNLKVHVQTKHFKQFKYKCDACDYKINLMCNLKRHIEVRHLKEFKYKCDTCDYKTTLKGNLKKHIEATHLKEFKYKCDTCDYKTSVKGNLKRHIEARHLKEFKYKCDACEYKTNQKIVLKRHIEAKHLKEFKYKCDICDYKTNRKNHLRRHVSAKHLKEFKYKCDTCDYKSNTKSCLKEHIYGKHLNEFKYKCDTCDYKTTLKSNLQRHIEARHLKLFKYKCDKCEYKANQKIYLKMHIETRHLREFK